jgi:signal transduction histidine kinase
MTSAASFDEVVKHNVLTGFNRFIYLALLAIGINIADSLLAGDRDHFDVNVLAVTACVLVLSLLLHQRKYTLWAKIISALAFNVAFLLIGLQAGVKSATYLYYFPLILAYIYMFRTERKKQWVVIFSVVTVCFLFVSLLFSDDNFQYPKEQVAEAKRTFYLSFFISFSLTVYYFILIYKYQEKLYRRILLLEATNRKQELRSVIEKQETVNQNIVYELRDGVNQLLAASKMYQGEAIANSGNRELLAKSYELTNDAMNAVTMLCIKLHPAVVADIGLVDGTREYIIELRKVNNVHIQFEYDDLAVESISQNDKFSVFRILQDYLDIVLKNSSATEVLLRLLYKPLQVTLMLSQNDLRFNFIEAIQTSKQSSINNRITYFNGVMQQKVDNDFETSILKLSLG